MDTGLEFGILGPLLVLRNGRPVLVRAGRQRALLASLLLRPNGVVSVDELVERVWGDQPPAKVRNTLQTYVMRLRQTLGSTSVIHTAPDGYRLDADPNTVDLLRFEKLVVTGSREFDTGNLAAAAAAFGSALALWRGPALADIPSTVLHREEVPRLAERRLHVLERRVDADLALGRHAELIAELTALTGEHPLRERFWAQLMTALHGAGRQADALAAYHRIATRLRDELGIDPGEELRGLRDRLAQPDPVLPAPVPRRTGWNTQVVPSQLPSDIADFVGRDEVVDLIDGLLRAQAGVPVVTVAGPPGVGKTALAVHVARGLREVFPDGQLYVNLRGYALGPPLSTAEVLSRFLRALGVPPEAVPLEQDEQEALYRSLLSGHRVLVVLDNAATAEQIRPLLPGEPGCAVLVTSRDTLRGLAVSHTAANVRLGVLNPCEAYQLLANMLDPRLVAAEQAALDELAALCTHLPLALRIAAANLAGQQDISVADYVAELRAGDRLAALAVDGDPRAAVRAAFDLSYAALHPDLAQLFRLLSLIPGAEFTAETAAALDASPVAEAQRRLTRLATANLIDNHAPGRYELHDLLREYAAERLVAEDPPDRPRQSFRRLLDFSVRSVDNAMVAMTSTLLRLPRPAPLPGVTAMSFTTSADALDWLDAERSGLVAVVEQAADPDPSLGAWHLADGLRGYFYARGMTVEWQAAGNAGLRAAQAAGDVAGEAAMWNTLGTLFWCIGRHREALEHYRKAVPLHEQGTLEQPTEQAEGNGHWEALAATLSNIGSVHIDLGELEHAVYHLEGALAITRRIGAVSREAIALTNLGGAYLQLAELDQAVSCFEQSLALGVRTGAWMTQANGVRGLAEAYAELGQPHRAAEHQLRARQLYRQVGARSFEHATFEGTAAVKITLRRYAEAISDATEAVAQCQELDNLKGECDARNQLGFALRNTARHAEAAEHHRTALRIGGETSYPWGVCVALRGLAEVNHALGNREEAWRDAKRALGVVRDYGLRLAEASVLLVLGRVLLDSGDVEGAARQADQVVRLTEHTGQRIAQAHALVLRAETRAAGNGVSLSTVDPSTVDDSAAVDTASLRRALRIFTEVGLPDAADVRALLGPDH